MYETIAAKIREEIDAGALEPGAKLPTEQELTQQWGVSRIVVRQATELLVNAGLVERRPGRLGGAFVRRRVMVDVYAWRDDQPMSSSSEADLFFRTVREQGYEPSQDFSVRIEGVPGEYAELLRVPVGDSAVVRRCVRYVNGIAHSIQDSWYPSWLCERVPRLRSPENIAEGTTVALAREGFEQVAAMTLSTARMPSPEDATLLHLPAGTPLLHNILVGYTKDGPLRISVASFASDRMRLVSVHGDVEVVARYRP